MHQQSVVPLPRTFSVSKILLKPGHHLFKRLLVDGLRCPSRVKMHLVHALCEQSSESPLRNTVRDIPNQLTTLGSCQVDVGLRMRRFSSAVCMPSCSCVFVALGSPDSLNGWPRPCGGRGSAERTEEFGLVPHTNEESMPYVIFLRRTRSDLECRRSPDPQNANAKLEVKYPLGRNAMCFREFRECRIRQCSRSTRLFPLRETV